MKHNVPLHVNNNDWLISLNHIFIANLSRQWLIRMILAHMLQTGTRLGKCLLTVITLVRSTTSVRTDMAHQGELHCEGLAANVTLVWAQTSVDTAMTLEIVGLCEGLSTLVTLKWTYTSVDQFMPGQGVPVRECLSTGIALKGFLLTVCPHMGQQGWLQCKCSATDLTGIRLHSSVRAAVRLKTALLGESTTTKVTLVRFLPCMN